MTALGVPHISPGPGAGEAPEDQLDHLTRTQLCRSAVQIAAEYGLALHPAEARKAVSRFRAAGGGSTRHLLAWIDPTANTALHNVTRDRGDRGGD